MGDMLSKLDDALKYLLLNYVVSSPKHHPEAIFPPFVNGRDNTEPINHLVKILYFSKQILELLGALESVSAPSIPGGALAIYLIGVLEQQVDLEEVIIKYVDNEIVTQSILLFQDRLHDVRKRLEAVTSLCGRNKSRISTVIDFFKGHSSMQIEITAAMSTCDQMYSHFIQKESIFYKYPLCAPTYLATFTAVYNSVISVASRICSESYQESFFRERKNEMRLLIEDYTRRFWENRFSQISYMEIEPTSIDFQYADHLIVHAKVLDRLNPDLLSKDMTAESYKEWIEKEPMVDYKMKVGEVYNEFFNKMYDMFAPQPTTSNGDTFNMKIIKELIDKK